MNEKMRNRLTFLLLMPFLLVTLAPLWLMVYASFKPSGTLTRAVSELTLAETLTLHPGESVVLPLGQDLRKFSQISFRVEKGRLQKGLIRFTDALGHPVTLPLDESHGGGAVSSLPLSRIDLSRLNPNVPEKTAEEAAFVLEAGDAEVILKEIRLFFKPFTVSNYIDVWVSGAFGRYLVNSVFITVCVVLGNLLFASMTGYVFARKEFPGKLFLFVFILGSLMIPPQVLMTPIFLLMKNLNWLNTYWALILPALVSPFNIFLMRQYISQLPSSLEDAARIDGATDAQIFFKIVLPLARPALAVVGINTFMGSWNTFLYPFLLTNTSEMRTLPVGLALYKSLQGVDWVHLMAGSSITALPVIVVFLLFQRHIIAGLTAGSVKG